MSTVKAPVRALEDFVERNLASGADHLVIFLDAPDADAETFLAAHPHVTHVVTDASYWRGSRPGNLNARQTINANLLRTALVPLPWAAWLFHIDADECLEIDRDHLERLEDSVQAVRLDTSEEVSSDDVRRRGWFKRRPTSDELDLLTALGIIARPALSQYFNGHVEGKVGVRPSLDCWIGIHHAKHDVGEQVPTAAGTDFRVLHHEGVSREEFVTGHLETRPSSPAKIQGRRSTVLGAVRALRATDLDTDRRRELLAEIYDRSVADPVDALDELGLLVRPDPARHAYAPRTIDRTQRRGLTEMIDALREQPLGSFHPNSGLAAPIDALDGAYAFLRSAGAETTEAVGAVLDRSRRRSNRRDQ
ncbi:glycosyltransferase family 2 protein [Isoptericola haloaureus]|uniref:Glycosyltransferase family 2 protein n=1 Tax=Isoptericola haloaureus TaxID=1542902 RepID=A0ABU7Z4Z5_9MICO